MGDTFNLGSGIEVTINELAGQVAIAAGRPGSPVRHDRPRPGDVLRMCSDMSHARESIGYRPQVPLVEGLAHLLAWYREQGATPDRLLEQEVVHNWSLSPEVP